MDQAGIFLITQEQKPFEHWKLSSGGGADSATRGLWFCAADLGEPDAGEARQATGLLQ